MYTTTERLSKGMAGVRARFLTVGEATSKRRGSNDPYGNGLDLETSL